MKKAVIIYNYFLSKDGKYPVIGGIQTYIFQLCRLLISMEIIPIVLQPAENDFEVNYDEIQVIGVKNEHYRKNFFSFNENNWQNLYDRAIKLVKPSNGLLIFAADQVSVKTKYPRVISIMHGIYWDLPANYLKTIGGRYTLIGKFPFIGDRLLKIIFTENKIRLINNVNNIVCVDYNFINWYRTRIPNDLERNYYVIPNFVEFPDNYKPNIERHRNADKIKILFARRFYEYRGTRIMVEAIKKLIATTGSKIEITFAGEGPDEEYIKRELENFDGFFIDKYNFGDSLNFHKKFHIAAIPSLASEGTSLSLAEAMAAGCAVVASNVGGLSNMIIDNYNGFLIMPTAEELYLALKKLTFSTEVRYQFAGRAYESALHGFNLETWQNKWKNVIKKVENIK